MFSPSSTYQHPYHQNFPNFGEYYPNNQHSIPNHPFNYSGDSSYSGTFENFQVNQGFPFYNPYLLPTQQASSSSFKNIIEGTTNGNDDEIMKELCSNIQNIDVNQRGRTSNSQRFREQEKEDINSIKVACNNNNLIELPTNFGDYWYFLKTKIYKNFKYYSNSKKKSGTSYLCSNETVKCKGRLNYKIGLKIEETQKHLCIGTEEYVSLVSICINSQFKNRMSTSYSIFISYVNNGIGKEQFIGTQEIGEECKEYPIPLGLEQIFIEIKWINVNLNLNDFSDKIVEKTFYVNDTKYLENNYHLILDLDINNYKWEQFSEEKMNKINKINYINKLPFGPEREKLIYEKSHFIGYLEKRIEQTKIDDKKKNKKSKNRG